MSLRGVCKKDEIIFMLIAPIHLGKPETMSNEPKRSEDRRRNIFSVNSVRLIEGC